MLPMLSHTGATVSPHRNPSAQPLACGNGMFRTRWGGHGVLDKKLGFCPSLRRIGKGVDRVHLNLSTCEPFVPSHFFGITGHALADLR
jgi:hypothetical protein